MGVNSKESIRYEELEVLNGTNFFKPLIQITSQMSYLLYTLMVNNNNFDILFTYYPLPKLVKVLYLLYK